MIEKEKPIATFGKDKKLISPNNPNQTENQGGRPSKLEKFLGAMEKVLNDEINSIIHTDEELFILANDKLKKADQICYASFKNYKASTSQEETETHNRFLALYKKALITQKNSLFKDLKKDNPQWQKFAWIIERKFSDWNLRTITENTNKNTNTNTNLDYEVEDSKELKDLLKDNGLI